MEEGSLLEAMCERVNLNRALKRVEANAGAAGIDGMETSALRAHLRQNWPSLRERLEAGTYRPQPVKRVMIPKPSGGERALGIPTVVDRFLQQALLGVLTPLYEPTFSEHSYGFRPGRSAHQAVEAARGYVAEGYGWVVDLDIEQFFDRVNHDLLMGRIAKRVTDKRVLKLIRGFLESGVLLNGVKVASEEGTPQGGPLSPLLANILLDDLDQELEKRGHRFVRYADDVNVYVRTERAGQRVLESVERFLAKKLKLKVNRTKSAVGPPKLRQILGFRLRQTKTGLRLGLAPRTMERVRARLRELTRASRGNWSMEERIRRIRQYLVGWMGYYRLVDLPNELQDLDGWLRRRLRMVTWRQWKQPKTRQKRLGKLGMPPEQRHRVASSKGPWRNAASPPMQQWLNTAYWTKRGLPSLVQLHRQFNPLT